MVTRTATYKDKTKAKRNTSRKARNDSSPENEVTERAPVGSYNEDQTIIQMAMDLFEDSQDGSNYNRIEAEEDIRFARLSEQWPKDVKQSREEDKRPCLTINKLPSFIRQVVNDARQNKPGIVVAPVDNGADKDTAEVYAGLVRSIERNSNADIAYDTAIDNAASCGFGFFQLSIDYSRYDSFDKEVRIVPVTNPLSVHWDVTDTSLDAMDWRYCFISELLNQKKFEEMYPDAMKVSFEGDINQRESWWLSDDGVRVSSFWLKEEQKKQLLQFMDKTQGEQGLFTILKEDFEADEQMVAAAGVGLLELMQERETEVPIVRRRTITGAEVLETLEWPGPTIPVCPVWGEVVVLDGRRYLRSMIRDAKDSQIMFNYWRTTATELVALQPKTPLLVKSGSIPEGHQHKYENANTKNYAYLEYEGDIPPQRLGFAGIPAGAIQEALNASDDIKAITGIHDASLGAQGNETSGKAILARQSESDVSNFHFTDNQSRAIQYAAKCIVDVIPSVYSKRQTIRILGEDMKEKVVRIGSLSESQEEGGERIYDLSIGKYDVTVKSGPSFSSQREETREVFLEMMRSMPQVAPYISDFLMEHMDFQGAEKLSKRLKLLLPPHIQKMEMQEDAKDLPPEFQEAMKQAQMIIQELEGKLKEAQNEQAPEMAKIQLERDKMEKETQGDGAKVNAEGEKARTEGMKAENEAQKIADDMTLKQEANMLQARKLDLEEKKIELEERKVEALEFEAVNGPDTPENSETPEKEEKGNGENKDSQAIQAGLYALAKGQLAPIKVERGKDGKISGAKRVMKETPETVN